MKPGKIFFELGVGPGRPANCFLYLVAMSDHGEPGAQMVNEVGAMRRGRDVMLSVAEHHQATDVIFTRSARFELTTPAAQS
jgi:hypothetical protein